MLLWWATNVKPKSQRDSLLTWYPLAKRRCLTPKPLGLTPARDPDLESLRQEPEFIELVGPVKADA